MEDNSHFRKFFDLNQPVNKIELYNKKKWCDANTICETVKSGNGQNIPDPAKKKSGNDRIPIRIRSKFYGSGRKCPKKVKFKSAYGKILRIRQKTSENGQIQIRIRQKSSGSGPKCPETTESKSAALD